jgi:hypothetical protein
MLVVTEKENCGVEGVDLPLHLAYLSLLSMQGRA